MFCMAKKSKSVKNCPLQREDYLLPQQSNFGFSSPRLLDTPMITVRRIWPQRGGANRIASIPKAIHAW